MKRYEVQMNDGEYVISFNQLKDAKKYVLEHFNLKQKKKMGIGFIVVVLFLAFMIAGASE